jgi:hypothetical protein
MASKQTWRHVCCIARDVIESDAAVRVKRTM